MIELPFPPSANRYWRNFRGRIVKSDEARQYQTNARWIARCAGMHEPITGKVAISLRVYRPAQRGDLDNRIKVLLDALQGVAYEDDKQIVELHAYQNDDKANPRVEVEVTEAI